MSSRRIVWLSVLGFHLICFFYLIPVHVYDRSNILLSFVGGALFFGILFMVLGDFDSMYDLVEKPEPDAQEVPGRKLAPFAVFPALILVFILIFFHGERKDNELATNGVLTKGIVTGGQSSKSRRSTSYDIQVTYEDSLHRSHILDQSVNGGDFHDLYEGAQVDVVYSRRFPSLAKSVLNVKQLGQFVDIPQEQLVVSHLVAILEGKIKKDSILRYLNSINYEWVSGTEQSMYRNDKLNIAIKHFPDEGRIAYVEKSNFFVRNGATTFESCLTEHGFKKKASNVNGETTELYYNDKFVIAKERKISDRRSSGAMSIGGFDIFHITKIDVGNN